MSAEILRRAASLMRERAERATPGPWGPVAGAFGNPSDGPDHMRVVRAPHRNAIDAIARTEYDPQGGADAEHIASWHPAVALRAARMLNRAADWMTDHDLCAASGCRDWDCWFVYDALTIARAYLGEDA